MTGVCKRLHGITLLYQPEYGIMCPMTTNDLQAIYDTLDVVGKTITNIRIENNGQNIVIYLDDDTALGLAIETSIGQNYIMPTELDI